MDRNVASLRKEYAGATLLRENVHPDPVEQFGSWFSQCREARLPEPNAMTLSCVGADSRPSSRMVLLKGIDEGGFTFFTNFESRKARELALNPFASLVFWWQGLERQVRIEGVVERIDDETAAQYFDSRPRTSQLGAWASPQSRTVESRRELEDRFESFAAQFPDRVPKPEHWGGFCLRPDRMEFWQGRQGRLHDRISYTLTGTTWAIERLAP